MEGSCQGITCRGEAQIPSLWGPTASSRSALQLNLKSVSFSPENKVDPMEKQGGWLITLRDLFCIVF